MRLLIITQIIDRSDPGLGFVHSWVEEFSKRFERLIVLCLKKGDYDLPGNVAVLSLGKERWKNRAKYLFLLFYFSLRYFNRYDAVLVHMNQEYVLVAGWLWKLFGKRVYMWRNHYAGSPATDIAAAFCDKIFCTSHYSYTARFKKTKFMPVGIDTGIFRPDQSARRKPGSILSLGRVAPSKNIHTLIQALGLLRDQGIAFTADIYGNAKPGDEGYAESLRQQAKEMKLEGQVRFMAGVPNLTTPMVYSAHQIFINLSPNGMYDKTIFEAMACGCFVFASNDDLRDKIDPAFAFKYNDPADLARKLKEFLAMPEAEQNMKAANISDLVEHHSLEKLSDELSREIK